MPIATTDRERTFRPESELEPSTPLRGFPQDSRRTISGAHSTRFFFKKVR